MSAEGSDMLEQSGRCALGNDTGTLSGHIRAVGRGRYDGSLSSPVMRGQAIITGTGCGRRLNLEAIYEDTRTQRPAKAVITLRLIAEGQYRMVTTATDLATGEPVRSSDILFKRQGP